jgi:CysZ protein
MNRVVRSLAFAVANVFHPRILWLMLWPVLVAVGVWGAVALVFWAQLALWLAGVLSQWLAKATFFIQWNANDVALIAAKILILLTLVPLIQLTALLILGMFGIPAMVEYVAAKRFPALQRRHGGSFAGSVWNSVVAIGGLLLLGTVSLPFWIFPPLAEHADAREMSMIFASRRGALYLLGVVLALVAYAPLIGFFAPALFGLAFIHYLLAELQESREAPLEVNEVRD